MKPATILPTREQVLETRRKLNLLQAKRLSQFVHAKKEVLSELKKKEPSLSKIKEILESTNNGIN